MLDQSLLGDENVPISGFGLNIGSVVLVCLLGGVDLLRAGVNLRALEI